LGFLLARGARQETSIMLRIYSDILSFQDDAREFVSHIRVHDSSLANQLRRAAQAIALNTAEGMAARDGNRRTSYSRALGEARECSGAIDVAIRWGYIPTPSHAKLDRLAKIQATLGRLTTPARQPTNSTP
jgi:four helix bundle protein